VTSQTSGFVVQYGLRHGPMRDVQVRSGQSERIALGPNFRIAVRPQPATPEAARDRQLLVTADTVVAYAGRVDNREEIASRLREPRLESATDGEVLARAYRAWGDRFGSIVIGEYSVAIVDRRMQGLVAARDSLGIGHLFRHDEGTCVWLASSLDMLLHALDRRPRLSHEGLAEYFAGGGLLTSGRTVYEGIVEVPPAHAIVVGGGRPAVTEYWHPDPARRCLFPRHEDYDEALRALLDAGVRAALRSQSPVWSDLSGGLDSSTVTAVAARLVATGAASGATLAAFSTVASQTTTSDESGYQADFLGLYRLEHHTVDADQYLSFASLPTISACHPSKAFVYGPLRRATSALFESHGVVTHLTGKGGDNVFCGAGFPPYYLRDLLRGLKVRQWWHEARAWSRVGNRSLLNLLRRCSIETPSELYGGAAGTETVIPGWLTPGFRDAIHGATLAQWQGGDRLFDSWAREIQYRSIKLAAATPTFTPIGDERSPLLYRPLVEFLLSIPWDHLVSPAQDRVIQRRALKGVLPESIRLRTSKAIGTDVLLRGLRENWGRLRDVTAGERLAALGLVDAPAFRAACERWRHGVLGRQLPFLAAALSVEIWLAASERMPAEGASLRSALLPAAGFNTGKLHEVSDGTVQ